MANTRKRKDAAKLPEWDPALLWYARGISEMQKRPMTDPTSWRFQAAIHDYALSLDPMATPGNKAPGAADQKRFWRQCQHFSWFFLPWHRMYLFYFEQIVAAAIGKLGGPADWALPYWNYSNTSNPDARRIPKAFREAKMPDGKPNPLLVKTRNPGVNGGGIVGDDDDVDLRQALGDRVFTADPIGGDPGFGGPKTGFNHSNGVVGSLEAVPHGSMHVAVGGWMGGFNTAGLDPIFWVHHANIDRLWTVWQKRDPAHHLNPTLPAWLTAVSFEFHDAAGKLVTMKPAQVVDTTAAPLLYDYEDVSDPLGPVPGREGVTVSENRPIPEMLGATAAPVLLKGSVATTSVAVKQPTGPARESVAPKKTYLNIENITGKGEPVSYSVYVNLPAGADPAQHRDLFAGVLPMFGVTEASETNDQHAGSGLHYALEISNVVKTLQARNEWTPENLQVTFVPKHRAPGREGVAAASPIQVGRVSVYAA